MTDPRLEILDATEAVAEAIANAGDGSYAWDANDETVKATWVLDELIRAGWKVVRA